MTNYKREQKLRFLRIRKFLWTSFVGGAVVLLPITLFILLVKLVFDFIRRIVEPLSEVIHFGSITNELLIDIIAFGLILAFCFVVGLFVQTRFGKGFFNYVDRQLLDRLPLYSTIKETVQQFTGAKKMPFSKVVLVDVYSNPTRMIGFITDEHENGYFTVFVPTGPNPTNGFIFYVSPDQIERLKVKPEEAMRVIIAVGSGAAKLFGKLGTEEKPKA